MECPGLGAPETRDLLRTFGLPVAIFDASHEQLARIVGGNLAQALRRPPGDPLEAQIEQTLSWSKGAQHHVLTLGAPGYPAQLLELPDPPLLIYASGQAELLLAPRIAILLSPQASRDGMRTALAFARALSRHGLGLFWEEPAVPLMATKLPAGAVVVRRGGLPDDASDNLVAPACMVCEHALMPAGHGRRRIGASRLLAALSRAVLMVEAGRSSSQWESARLAAELGREVFAIPGSIHSPHAKASHRLIKEGAKLVETADDILSEWRT